MPLSSCTSDRVVNHVCLDQHVRGLYTSPWTELLDLQIFDGFEPGMTVQEAQKALRPHRTGRNRLGEYVEFDRALGTVRVGFEDHGSTPLPVDRFWVVRAFPKNQSRQALFSHEVQEYLPADDERLELVVMNNCGYPAVEVILRNGDVEVLTWLDTPGSRMRAVRGTSELTN